MVVARDGFAGADGHARRIDVAQRSSLKKWTFVVAFIFAVSGGAAIGVLSGGKTTSRKQAIREGARREGEKGDEKKVERAAVPAKRDGGSLIGPAKGLYDKFAGSLVGIVSDDPYHTVTLHRFCDGKHQRGEGRGPDSGSALAYAAEALAAKAATGTACVEAMDVFGARIVAGELEDFKNADKGRKFEPDRHAAVLHGNPDLVFSTFDFVHGVEPIDSEVKRKDERSRFLNNAVRARGLTTPKPNTRVEVYEAKSFADVNGVVQPVKAHRVRRGNVSEETLTQAIRDAAAWFGKTKKVDEGRFYYVYTPANDRYEERDYNLLRHAGSSWALAQAYGLTGDPATLETLEYALAWLVKQSRTEERNGKTLRYPVEQPGNAAKLGGAGLWLLALSEHARVTGSTRYLSMIQEVANHIAGAQDPATGAFKSFHDGPGLNVKGHVSTYYPGEAMFGLHRAKPFITGIDICAVTKKGMDYMFKDEPRTLLAQQGRVINQWHAYVVREYRRDCKDDHFDWFFERDLPHLKHITAQPDAQPIFAGAIAQSRGRLSFSPTHFEAFTVMCIDMAREKPGEAEECAKYMQLVGGAQMTFQHHPSNTWVFANAERANGGLGRNLTEERIRIDDTQHHLSAMYNNIEFIRLFGVDGKGGLYGGTAPQPQKKFAPFPFDLVTDTTCKATGSCRPDVAAAP